MMHIADKWHKHINSLQNEQSLRRIE